IWDEYRAVMNPTGALDGKTKQLIALGVAAQIPCAYCVYAHTKAARAAGATDAQIKEAIATAALVRFNSTMLNGSDGGPQVGITTQVMIATLRAAKKWTDVVEKAGIEKH